MNNTIYPLSQWSFNEEVSNRFDDHVRQSVPMYDSIQKILCHLSDFFITPKGIVYDLGCATGETIYYLSQRHKNKQATFIGVDDSKPMLQKAIEKNKENGHIQFVHESLEKYQFDYKGDMILSILTMHFIPIKQRENVFFRIFNALNKGGAFLLVEKSYSDTSKVQDMFTQIYHDYKEEQGLSAVNIREKDKSLRGVLTPLSISENLELLKASGFETVEIFFKYLHFIGFLAIK